MLTCVSDFHMSSDGHFESDLSSDGLKLLTPLSLDMLSRASNRDQRKKHQHLHSIEDPHPQ